jgi:hypothetical protein
VSGEVEISWRSTIKASVRRRGQGVVVSIRVSANDAWHEVLKIDAFGRAHWHLYCHGGREEVRGLEGQGGLRGGDAILGELAAHLVTAGYGAAVAELSKNDERRLVEGICDAVDNLIEH